METPKRTNTSVQLVSTAKRLCLTIQSVGLRYAANVRRRHNPIFWFERLSQGVTTTRKQRCWMREVRTFSMFLVSFRMLAIHVLVYMTLILYLSFHSSFNVYPTWLMVFSVKKIFQLFLNARNFFLFCKMAPTPSRQSNWTQVKRNLPLHGHIIIQQFGGCCSEVILVSHCIIFLEILVCSLPKLDHIPSPSPHFQWNIYQF